MIKENKCQYFGILMGMLIALTGCQSVSTYIPVYSAGDHSHRAGQYHLVRKGDTLYSIAFKYGLDYKRLANSNGIGKPYTIFLGQKIKLASSSKQRVASHTSTPQRQKNATKSKIGKVKSTTQRKSQYPKLNWRWPVAGDVLNPFTLTGKVNKGIDIKGRLGESVHNAADGVVVYAGGGLRGYGKLVIVKHNDHFLSAYGHNRTILVKEGDKVKGGQVVAEIGSSDANQEILHFEIRRDGKPEDPLIYLPNRRGKL